MLEYSQADYARHRGVTKQAISKLMQAGKIPFREEGGRKLIDVAAADRALGESRERINARDDEPAGGFAPAGETAGLTKARTATEVYRARIAQLEYEERVGRLLKADDVVDAMETFAGLMVREIDQIPTLAEDVVAAALRGGVTEVRAVLREQARSLRQAIAEKMTLEVERSEGE